MEITPGTEVRLGGRTVAPFKDQLARVKAVVGDRLLVLVTVDGARQEIAVSPNDVAVVSVPQPPKQE